MAHKILIMGLPGAGKTTLARALAPLLKAVVFNADDVRKNLSKDLGFSHEDRIEHACRMGWLCDRVVESGGTAIADFVCPTEMTRAAFGKAFVIWVNRVEKSIYPDTNLLFEPPENADIVIETGKPEFWASEIYSILMPSFDPGRPTALFVGRFQPFHEGHKHLVMKGLTRVGQACIAVRDTFGGEQNPLTFHAVKQRIETALTAFTGKFIVVPLPNITNIFYGRRAGYSIERIALSQEIEEISATQIRARGHVR